VLLSPRIDTRGRHVDPELVRLPTAENALSATTIHVPPRRSCALDARPFVRASSGLDAGSRTVPNGRARTAEDEGAVALFSLAPR